MWHISRITHVRAAHKRTKSCFSIGPVSGTVTSPGKIYGPNYFIISFVRRRGRSLAARPGKFTEHPGAGT